MNITRSFYPAGPLWAILVALPAVAPVHAQTQEPPPPSAPPAFTRSLLNRVHILEAEQVTRFNYMDRESGPVTDRDLQYRVRFVVQTDLAARGATYLRFRAENGRGFDNSWDNTGLGSNQGVWNFNVKSLYLGQKLGRSLEAQAGGIEFDRGAGSQLTYASDDGHLVGYRLAYAGTQGPLHVDKLSLTLGYAGDFNEPSVFSRFHMGKLNYVQALAQHKFGDNVEASAQLDSIRGVWLTREAVRVHHVFDPIIEEARVEAVTRGNSGRTFGWSTTLLRPIDSSGRWHAYGLYAHIPARLYAKDGELFLLNQGEIDLGKRIALGAACALTKDLEIGVFAGRLLDHTASKRSVAQVFVSYQYARLLNRLIH